MCAPRSVYPWDIVIVREGDKLFFDKRDGGPFDTVTVNENAADPPQDPTPPNPNNPAEKAVPETPSINSATSLSLEATYINQNFGFQTVIETPPPPAVDLAKPNPFYGPEETEPLASCGYRYRVFDLGITEDEDLKICVRTEVDAYSAGQGNPRLGQGLVTIRALNEFDPRAPGAGGAPDWRTKLDSQRGAVVATEMKNNSCKLAKWTVQSILAGADLMKIGYVVDRAFPLCATSCAHRKRDSYISRANPRDNTRHVILSTTSVRPTDFASQLNVSLANGWGIVRTVADILMKQPEGKYVLVKDPNKVRTHPLVPSCQISCCHMAGRRTPVANWPIGRHSTKFCVARSYALHAHITNFIACHPPVRRPHDRLHGGGGRRGSRPRNGGAGVGVNPVPGTSVRCGACRHRAVDIVAYTHVHYAAHPSCTCVGSRASYAQPDRCAYVCACARATRVISGGCAAPASFNASLMMHDVRRPAGRPGRRPAAVPKFLPSSC